MKNKFIILSFFLFCIPFLSFATIYKWVDENNHTHYSETPPSGVDAIAIPEPPSPSSSAQSERERYQTIQKEFDKTQDKEKKEKEQTEKAAQLAKEKAANCQAAKSHLEALLSRPRVRLQSPSGATTYLTPEDREKEIEKTKEMIEKNCS